MAYTEKKVSVKKIELGDKVNFNVIKGSIYTLDKKECDPETGIYTLKFTDHRGWKATRVLSGKTRLVVRKPGANKKSK